MNDDPYPMFMAEQHHQKGYSKVVRLVRRHDGTGAVAVDRLRAPGDAKPRLQISVELTPDDMDRLVEWCDGWSPPPAVEVAKRHWWRFGR